MKVYVLWKYPRRIYLLKVDHRKTRARCKICTKLTIKAPGQRQWRRFSAIIVKFEYISLCSSVSIVNFKRNCRLG